MSYSLEESLYYNKKQLCFLQKSKKDLIDLLHDDVGRMGQYHIEYKKCCQKIILLKKNIDNIQQKLDSRKIDIIIENDDIQESNGFGQFCRIDDIGKKQETYTTDKIKNILKISPHVSESSESLLREKGAYPTFYRKLGSVLFLVSSISWFCMF